MKTKVFIVFAVLAAFVILAVSGCATYWAKGVMPNLNDPSSLAVKEKMVTKIEDGLTVTVYPITDSKEVDKYFDEDLLGKGITPVFIEIRNEDSDVNLVAVTFSNGNDDTSPSMTPNDLYGVIKRDWVGRATIWMFPTYFVGAPISALATHITNIKIQEDLGVEGDGGKLLKLGKIPKGAVIKGFLCFRGLVSADSKKKGVVKLIFGKGGRLLEFNLNIS